MPCSTPFSATLRVVQPQFQMRCGWGIRPFAHIPQSALLSGIQTLLRTFPQTGQSPPFSIFSNEKLRVVAYRYTVSFDGAKRLACDHSSSPKGESHHQILLDWCCFPLLGGGPRPFPRSARSPCFDRLAPVSLALAASNVVASCFLRWRRRRGGTRTRIAVKNI